VTKRKGEVFLSHSSKDRAFVERLAGVLDEHAIAHFYSRRDILGAQQWHDELGDALQRCKWFVLVLSPSSVASVWVKWELLYALQRRQYEDRILPILLRKCAYAKLSWTLDGFQHIDFRTRRDQATEAFLGALSAGRISPT
jgi:hypothetical protein